MSDTQQTYEIQHVLAPGWAESWKIRVLANRIGGGALLRIVDPSGKGPELFLMPKQVRQLVAALNGIQPLGAGMRRRGLRSEQQSALGKKDERRVGS